MNAFSESTMAAAQRVLDNAIAHFEQYADTAVADPKSPANTSFSAGFAELLRLRGALHAISHLEHMAEIVGSADTERPAALRLVK